MVIRRFWCKIPALHAFFLLLPTTKCHMEMSWPFPLRSKYNPLNSYADIDYSMTSPLNADGSNFPCKGYQNDRPMQPVVTYATGSTYNMSVQGSATHGGGSCQISLSYDNGATFKVINSIIGDCPLATTYDFTIPSDAPAGQALLAWTWQNLIGNREYYMNCAEVNIISGLQKRRHRHQTFKAFGRLPDIFRANLQGLNDCVTVENVPVIYPDPGPHAVYGEGLNTTSTPAIGNCNGATPYGQTYKNLAENSSEKSPSPEQTNELDMSNSYTLNADQRVASFSSVESYSTTTVTVDCQTTITLTTMPSFYVTAAPSSACTGTSASCPCALDYQCLELSPCTWGCEATLKTTAKITNPEHSAHLTSRSTLLLTISHTVVPVKSTSPPHPAGGTSGSHPPYAGTGVQHYLPCVARTFICVDRTTWDTCDYDANGNWVYEYPRTVATGMACITFLSRYSDGTAQHGQQGLTPQGYYRDDRIVRARPDGDCSQNGAIKCTQNGSIFEVCDQGGWVNMGPVATGTRCENGQIV